MAASPLITKRAYWLDSKRASWLYTRTPFCIPGGVSVHALWIGVALAASVFFTGCRFGNYVEAQPSEPQVSGYFQSQPQSLTFYTTHTTSQQTSAPVNQIPAQVALVMTNPVAFILDDPATGASYLAASDASGYALPIYYDPGEALSYVGSTSPQVLWEDAACTTMLQVEESGQLTRFTSPQVLGDFQTVGRVRATIRITRVIEGTCAATLTALANCYGDLAQCGGSSPSENAALQASVIDFFAPYITAGTMTAADIPNVQGMAYEARYE